MGPDFSCGLSRPGGWEVSSIGAVRRGDEGHGQEGGGGGVCELHPCRKSIRNHERMNAILQYARYEKAEESSDSIARIKIMPISEQSC